MGVLSDLYNEFITILWAVLGAVPYVVAYVVLILLILALWGLIGRRLAPRATIGFRKTVTFGDESAVSSNFVASVISVVMIFVLWGAFTGSALLPGFMRVPGAFSGLTSFEYTVEAADGTTDTARVNVLVHGAGEKPDAPNADVGTGPAKGDALAIQAYRSKLLKWDANDDITRKDGAKIVAIDGTPIAAGESVNTHDLRVALTPKGTLNVQPDRGWQMEPIWLPAPERVWEKFTKISEEGFKGATLAGHLGFSLFRVIIGFILGALVGIPLGYAMGLSNWFRGWFDPIVEFMRPVPPLALIPLVIIWAGIGEVGKVILLFLAALWIMAIAARSGVSGVKISKVHAAYSLGASKWQVMRFVIIPNSLPEIFTGARVAMGVCWGTVVAAELVAAEKGAGMMIMAAAKFQQTDIVILGIIMIGVIGFSIDMLMRWAEKILVPWKGKG